MAIGFTASPGCSAPGVPKDLWAGCPNPTCGPVDPLVRICRAPPVPHASSAAGVAAAHRQVLRSERRANALAGAGQFLRGPKRTALRNRTAQADSRSDHTISMIPNLMPQNAPLGQEALRVVAGMASPGAQLAPRPRRHPKSRESYPASARSRAPSAHGRVLTPPALALPTEPSWPAESEERGLSVPTCTISGRRRSARPPC